MKTFILTFCCMFFAASAHAACNSNMPASTPDSQFVDHSNGTVTDSKTGLMWKKCVEGVSGSDCENGWSSSFTWQGALQQPGTVNAGGGFAGHIDWRLPNIKELRSLVEEQCYAPAINLNRFPNTQNSIVWSGSPFAAVSDTDNATSVWNVNFGYGFSFIYDRYDSYEVRLVRGGR
ncbi:MAG: Lcl C-terminal domain-containing protein [Candidatus Electronema sp. V4]|uniref:Lcl C-terminal domain-containing protein n=1 Tax=Candidatus Electronema sp. V4 TaxID=3454756 RepID=UPI0040555B06